MTSHDKTHTGKLLKDFVEKLLYDYARLLNEKPILTKAATSGVVAATGDIISQLIAKSSIPGYKFRLRSTVAISTFGFIFNGPLVHYFYNLLENIVPKSTSYAGIKKVLFDRLIFAPPYLLLFFYVVAILEGQGSDGAIKKIREVYWMALKMNWRIWTVFQYVNVNYVPLKYRSLFANMVSLIWTIYIAAKRR